MLVQQLKQLQAQYIKLKSQEILSEKDLERMKQIEKIFEEYQKDE
jgi:hypothetical protein